MKKKRKYIFMLSVIILLTYIFAFAIFLKVKGQIDEIHNSAGILPLKTNEMSLYRSLQVNQTKVIYPRYIQDNNLKTLEEIVEKNYSDEKYVAVRLAEANLNSDAYPDAVFVIYSDLGKEKINKNWDYSIDHRNPNTNPGRLLSVNNFDLISTRKGCAFVVLGNDDSSTVVSSKCFDEYEGDNPYYFHYFNYGSFDTDVQVLDFNDDGIDDLIRVGMSTDDYESTDRHYISAVFQGFSNQFELVNLESIDDSKLFSEETKDYMFAPVADTFEDKGIYKHNKNGFAYYKEETVPREGERESCEVTSWKWLHNNLFEYSKAESARATKSACATHSTFSGYDSSNESMVHSDVYNGLLKKEVDLNGKKYEAVGTEDSFVKKDGFIIKKITNAETKEFPEIKKCFKSITSYNADEDNACLYGGNEDKYINYLFGVFQKTGF